MTILKFPSEERKQENAREGKLSRYENRLAFNSELPSLITSNPGEFALYEKGVCTGFFETRNLAKANAKFPGFTIFEIPSS